MASSEPISTEAEPENLLSSLIYVIEEDIEKCKGSALERKKALDEERDNFQKAAYAVLDMLNRE
ncbi:unnamed protein product [Sphenostylis stenocarpa]|uniref:Uncharacterized protein n=1 Tax=Sphenostylis stenocarpa TaxID=92480 RepID=A0AA86VMJ1_9FABA|nr:unnamed protein product [Sphenostylis stenocarpa]